MRRCGNELQTAALIFIVIKIVTVLVKKILPESMAKFSQRYISELLQNCEFSNII